MEKDLRIAVSAINERLANNKVVNEGLLESLSSYIAKILNGEFSASGLGSDYSKLDSSVRAAFANCYYEDSKTRKALSVGALWGMIELVDQFASIGDESRLETERYSVIEKYRDLFRLVENRPGVSHGKLADGIGKSKGRLTQIMSEIAGYKLLVFHAMGRTKHYYLSATAERLLEGLDNRPPSSLAAPLQSREEYVECRWLATGTCLIPKSAIGNQGESPHAYMCPSPLKMGASKHRAAELLEAGKDGALTQVHFLTDSNKGHERGSKNDYYKQPASIDLQAYRRSRQQISRTC